MFTGIVTDVEDYRLDTLRLKFCERLLHLFRSSVLKLLNLYVGDFIVDNLCVNAFDCDVFPNQLEHERFCLSFTLKRNTHFRATGASHLLDYFHRR